MRRAFTLLFISCNSATHANVLLVVNNDFARQSLVIFWPHFFQAESLIICILFFVYVVEEPSYDFIRLRDYVDTLDCGNLSAFAPANLRNGFSDKMVQQAREELKINKVRNTMERGTWGIFF